MGDTMLFWAVLGWMVAMLVLAGLVVREVWRETARPNPDADPRGPLTPTPPPSEHLPRPK